MRSSASNRYSRSSNPIELLYVSAPEVLADGAYDAAGAKLDAQSTSPSLIVSSLPGPVWQFWAIFTNGLASGQFGYLTFNNIKGKEAVAGAFTEWDTKNQVPSFSDSLMTLHSVQRAPGRVRIIGRNASNQRTVTAAGFLFMPPA